MSASNLRFTTFGLSRVDEEAIETLKKHHGLTTHVGAVRFALAETVRAARASEFRHGDR